MTNTTTQRRHFFIKKAFQTRFILSVLGLIILSSLGSALLIYWMTGGDLQAQSQSAHANLVTAWERLGLSILLGNAVAILIVGAVTVISVLHSSHKIAGPLYRFETLCRDIGEGKLDTVTQLRENDQLQELAQSFSVMVTGLTDRRDQRIKIIAELQQQLSVLSNSIDSGVSLEMKNSISLISAKLHELAKFDK